MEWCSLHQQGFYRISSILVKMGIDKGTTVCYHTWCEGRLLRTGAQRRGQEVKLMSFAEWWEQHSILSATAYKAYKKAITPAGKAYQEAIATVYKACHEATATAYKAYQEARATADKAYQEARAPADKAYWAAVAVPGRVLLYKGTRNNGSTRNGVIYAVGKTVTAPDWKDINVECGNGLHFCTDPQDCAGLVNYPVTRWFAVSVKASEVRCLIGATGKPDKFRARSCKVLYECDVNGKKLEDGKQ